MKETVHDPECGSDLRLVNRHIEAPIIRHPFTGRSYFGDHLDITNRQGQRLRVTSQQRVEFASMTRCAVCDQILSCSGSHSISH